MALLVKKPDTKPQFVVFIAAMVMMSMIGIFSSDIYLPSMPYMASYFGVDYGVIQKTITVYLVGLAVFQLFYGPISDHFGRRRVLIAGLTIYIAASLGCVLSSSVTQLLLFRFFQAVGACAGLVMGRTIVTDMFDKSESPHVFSIVLPFVAMSPAIAPVIGGHVQELLGWRFVMAFTVLFGSVLLGIVFFSWARPWTGATSSRFIRKR
ncbi:MAG: MFS transporter [Acidihalobacter sp.]|uniref:MFS transporter n=1 Tax=Acidihalobacter sp. TaxID=1872108 RepID=UPI00307E7FC6